MYILWLGPEWAAIAHPKPSILTLKAYHCKKFCQAGTRPSTTWFIVTLFLLDSPKDLKITATCEVPWRMGESDLASQPHNLTNISRSSPHYTTLALVPLHLTSALLQVVSGSYFQALSLTCSKQCHVKRWSATGTASHLQEGCYSSHPSQRSMQLFYCQETQRSTSAQPGP